MTTMTPQEVIGWAVRSVPVRRWLCSRVLLCLIDQDRGAGQPIYVRHEDIARRIHGREPRAHTVRTTSEALRWLVQVGLVELVHPGGRGRGDRAAYRVLYGAEVAR